MVVAAACALATDSKPRVAGETRSPRAYGSRVDAYDPAANPPAYAGQEMYRPYRRPAAYEAPRVRVEG